MSTLNGFGYISEVKTLPGGKTRAAKITLLAGQDKDGKKRYNNGSFIVTSKSKGVEAISKELESSGEDVFVKVEIKDFYATGSLSEQQKVFVNCNGLLNSIEKHTKKAE